jgi:hypothetical protein
MLMVRPPGSVPSRNLFDAAKPEVMACVRILRSGVTKSDDNAGAPRFNLFERILCVPSKQAPQKLEHAAAA